MTTPLKLYLQEPDPALTVYGRRGGVSFALPQLRLVAYANFMRSLIVAPDAPRFGITKAVVDTGAHYSIVAERLWRLFRPGVCTPLPFDSRTPARLRTLTVAGGTFPYTLAELRFDLQDLDLNVLPVLLVAKLVNDGGRLPLALVLGLRGGFFEGHTLTATPDAGAPHGQSWAVSAF